ncbi:MAG: type VI secretion system baseplate subunit TssF [Deltaproteobacteria bacterium]|nr:MAG: type VI secretion system baseplate subunit TssF [Deltaproteobacteria bacterium]
MFSRYFQEELGYLKDLAVAFAKEHPALAPMLSGPSVDPDVERLLEGVAFLTALLREKLDDEFPELVHELMQLIWPHYLRPVPCTSIVAFSPKPTLKQPIEVPPGTYLASVSIEGTSCTFRTCYPVELHPLELIDAKIVERPGAPPGIALIFQLRGMKLSDWRPSSLRLYLSDDYANASNLYMLLNKNVREIVFRPLENGQAVTLGNDAIHPIGFSEDEGLLPYPSNSFPGYRLFQEYFILPEKYLFLEIRGWDKWPQRGEGEKFEIFFQLDQSPSTLPRVRKDSFQLFATPVVNIFPHEADPIRLDHKKTDYLVNPAATNSSHYQVYSVERVVGYVQGTAEERIYRPFDLFTTEKDDTPVYHVKHKRTPVKRGVDVYLSVAYPPSAGSPSLETLSISLLCTNGALPEGLQLGDICEPTSSSPEFATFGNIRPMTANILPPLGSNLLWQLLGHLALNYLSLSSAENLKSLLQLYVFTEGRDRPAVLANQKRISSIERVDANATDRIVNGILMRGQEIRIRMRSDHFAGDGDMYLFGSVLDRFLGGYAALNSFTQLAIEETSKGELYQWPARLGDRPLL